MSDNGAYLIGWFKFIRNPVKDNSRIFHMSTRAIMSKDLTFFEAIAKSFEGISQWFDAATSSASRRDSDRTKGGPPPPSTSHMTAVIVPESAIKKYKLDQELYVSTYPSLALSSTLHHNNTKDATVLQMQSTEEDLVMDDIAMRFHRSVYVRKNPNIAAAQRIHLAAKDVHMTNTAEYTRHLARLDRLDKSQLNSARPRAWKCIAQANVKLTAMDALVRDFESSVRPKPDVVDKILSKLDSLKAAIALAGQDAVSLLVEELQSLETPLRGSFSGVFLHVFSYLTTVDIVVRCQLVSATWNNAIVANQVVSRSMRSAQVRGRFWRHAIAAHCQRAKARQPERSTASSSHPSPWCYQALLDRAIKDDRNRYHRAIFADVHRTTFVRTEHMYPPSHHGPAFLPGNHRLGTQIDMSDADVKTLTELQLKLAHVLMAYCQLDPDVGYCHGMTFLGASLLTCLDNDEPAAFHAFAAAMQHYEMAHLFRLPDLPGTTTRMHQLHNLIRVHLPALFKCLRTHRIHPHMYSSGWVMSLFLNEPSLSPSTVAILLDEFFRGGWPHMFRIYLGLLSVHADSHIITAHANHTLRALVQLPKLLDASLPAVLDHGRTQFAHATSDDALDIMAVHNDPTASIDYF